MSKENHKKEEKKKTKTHGQPSKKVNIEKNRAKKCQAGIGAAPTEITELFGPETGPDAAGHGGWAGS